MRVLPPQLYLSSCWCGSNEWLRVMMIMMMMIMMMVVVVVMRMRMVMVVVVILHRYVFDAGTSGVRAGCSWWHFRPSCQRARIAGEQGQQQQQQQGQLRLRRRRLTGRTRQFGHRTS